jgi:hypothetical protein
MTLQRVTLQELKLKVVNREADNFEFLTSMVLVSRTMLRTIRRAGFSLVENPWGAIRFLVENPTLFTGDMFVPGEDFFTSPQDLYVSSGRGSGIEVALSQKLRSRGGEFLLYSDSALLLKKR